MMITEKISLGVWHILKEPSVREGSYRLRNMKFLTFLRLSKTLLS